MKYHQPEVTLRQLILKDMANKESNTALESNLKQKTEQAVAEVKRLLAQSENYQLDGLILVTAAYAHLWGQVFTNHYPNQLAAEKIERLLFYRLAKYYDQQQIFEIVRLVEQQNLKADPEDQLLKLLQKALSS